MAASDTKIVILGGRGMLGCDLTVACRQQGYKPLVLDLPEFDITRIEHLKQVVRDAGLIVNCAAYTNVDGAESHAELARQVNAEAVGQLGSLAREHDTYVLHISTDFVFDGRSDEPYVETDHPNPINTYGKTKLEGEQLLSQSGCKHCILRVEWTYGSAGVNFITKLIERAKSTKALKVVDDQVGSPTATTEVSKAICKLLNERPEGVFHFASTGYISRYEMAKFIAAKLLMGIDVAPCKTSDFPSPAARPLNSRFNCGKIQGLLGGPAETWQRPLERFLRLL